MPKKKILVNKYTNRIIVEEGGPGSGHHHHKGRKGEVGGSLPESGGAGEDGGETHDYEWARKHAFKRVYLRTGGRTTNTNGFAMVSEEPVVGWFANKYNMAEGWVLQALSEHTKGWLAEAGIDVGDIDNPILRATSGKGSTLVKLNLQTGNVAFFDNQHLTETDEPRFEKASPYNRLYIDEGAAEYFTDDIATLPYRANKDTR